MNWAAHKRVLYAVGAFFVLALLFSIPIYRFVTIPPSCTDGKQNGDERGVDCGGACALLCKDDVRKPIVHWSRVFPVSPGIYDAVAYVENQDTSARAEEAIYRFKVYDAENVLILEKIGKTRMEAGEAFAIFLGGIKTGTSEPKRVFFEFEPDIIFSRATRKEASIVALSPVLTSPDASPRLTVDLKNRTALTVRDIDVIALIYGGENAIAASATYVDEIKGNNTGQVLFTWPHPIVDVITRIEIIPRPRHLPSS